MKKKIAITALLMILSTALCGSRADALESIQLPVAATWSGGVRGMVERSLAVKFFKGQELLALRGGVVVGMFTVDFIGMLNVWGKFNAPDPALALALGDLLVVPAEDMPGVLKLPAASVEIVRVLFGVPGGFTIWCLVDRGSTDGLKPLMRGAAWRGTENIGDFMVSFVGEHRSYGMLTVFPLVDLASYRDVTVKFGK